MKKLILFIAVALFLLGAVKADVGIVVQFSNGDTITECVSVPDGTDGYDLLQASSFDTEWGSSATYGHSLCKIDLEGSNPSGSFCENSDQYWAFFVSNSTGWQYSPVGYDGGSTCWYSGSSSGDHYCAKHGDVLGYKYVDSSAWPAPEPTFYAFDQICGVSKLEITKLRVYVDDNKDSGADESGGDVEAKPGSTLRLVIKVENQFSDDEDLDIEDIEVEAILDLDEEEEEYADIGDLDAGEDDEVEIEFKIPLDVDEDTYDLEIEAVGDDENNNQHKDIVKIEVDIKKEKHKLIIDELSFSGLPCEGYGFLAVEIANIGKKDEDAVLTVTNSLLGIDLRSSFELDKGKETEKSFNLELSGVQNGVYPLAIRLEYSDETESETYELDIDCQTTTSGATQTAPALKSGFDVVVQSTPATGAAVAKPKKSLLENYGLVALILLVEIVLILVAVAVIIKGYRG